MTTHGRGGVRRAWLGSVADELVRTLELPLIILRPEEKRTAPQPIDLAKIGVPLDGSPTGRDSARTGAGAGPDCGARRSRWSRWSGRSCSPAILNCCSRRVMRIRRPGSGKARLRATSRRSPIDFGPEGVKATGVALLGGAITDTLLDFFQSEKVGLVAISTHGRGGVRRLVLGSVATSWCVPLKCRYWSCGPVPRPDGCGRLVP